MLLDFNPGQLVRLNNFSTVVIRKRNFQKLIGKVLAVNVRNDQLVWVLWGNDIEKHYWQELDIII